MKKLTKQARQLPGRGALNDLAKTGRTITDYSKASPIKPETIQPTVIQNLRKPRR